MNVLNRILSFANGAAGYDGTPNPRYTSEAPELPVFAIPEGVGAIRARLEELPNLMADAQAEVEAVALRQRHAADTVRRFTEQAAAGKLKDSAKLADALFKQGQLSADSDESHQQRLAQLRAEENALLEGLQRAQREAIQKDFQDALHAYCHAARVLPALSRRVREAATAAAILITKANSPDLIDDSVYINGALIDLGSEMYARPSTRSSVGTTTERNFSCQ